MPQEVALQQEVLGDEQKVCNGTPSPAEGDTWLAPPNGAGPRCRESARMRKTHCSVGKIWRERARSGCKPRPYQSSRVRSAIVRNSMKAGRVVGGGVCALALVLGVGCESRSSGEPGPCYGSPYVYTNNLGQSVCDLDETGRPVPRGSLVSRQDAGTEPPSSSQAAGDDRPTTSGTASLLPDAGPSAESNSDLDEVAEPACPGCLIDGQCLTAGVKNPDKACEECAPNLDAYEWSPTAGKACDDGQYCTIDDHCEAGVCVGMARECEDGVACNGISVCDEDEDECSEDENQCGATALCDTATDTCVNTCLGCVVATICVPVGATLAGNPCLVCDPAQSSTSYSLAVGAPCGVGKSECSGQDLCNAQGQCVPNHLPSGSPCDGGGGQCQEGQCLQLVPDGRSCTRSASCRSGQCRAFFADNDRDGFAPAGAAEERFCTAAPHAFFTVTRPASPTTTDCDDTSALRFPAQPLHFEDPTNGSYDYDCSGSTSTAIQPHGACGIRSNPSTGVLECTGDGYVPFDALPFTGVPVAGDCGEDIILIRCIPNPVNGSCTIGTATDARLACH